MPEIAALAIGISLLLYALTGGADFGGGVWDLLARGPRADAQRRLVSTAIAPIWEVNHIWMIVVVVLLFVCFPSAFSAISIALHLPLTLMLAGIVLRGAAFSFQAYGLAAPTETARWERLFAVSSALTPVLLGVCVGAIVSGRIRVAEGVVQGGFVDPWLAPFPFAVGAFFLAICAYLAAVYLCLEADGDLQGDFRRRAIAAGAAVGVAAWAVLALSVQGAPLVHAALLASRAALPLQVGVGAAAIGAIAALAWRRYRLARALAVAQVAGIFLGWGAAQYPYLLVPDLTVRGAAAPDTVLAPNLATLGLGAIVLLPAIGWLLRIFKRQAL